ncbi:hypothetical protein [Nocardia sp. NPDC055049]
MVESVPGVYDSERVADAVIAAGWRPPACENTATEPDRAPVDLITVPFETVLLVYLDGFGTGAATALAKIKPEASHLIIDDAAQALVNMLQIDPAAVEQLRDHIRGRLRGEADNRITEVPVWTPKDGE